MDVRTIAWLQGKEGLIDHIQRQETEIAVLKERLAVRDEILEVKNRNIEILEETIKTLLETIEVYKKYNNQI